MAMAQPHYHTRLTRDLESSPKPSKHQALSHVSRRSTIPQLWEHPWLVRPKPRELALCPPTLALGEHRHETRGTMHVTANSLFLFGPKCLRPHYGHSCIC
ncbi:hypothetical protein B0T26DRAFT_686631 [Lasiosphaeria miniovina]|uniref:Uncharacterized protein n=1 Tax=Lasiosphaeria miniovina TaxID=1954250 RepID=A0AA40BGU2_9PEZI|nr:uncharacterized protein B0T26DRAFT_686631 [Lasiosphaeria miniovina]KAK0733977.1 hypothetical protein B0T26DRAFT_686631 [Lasiosphaeria miniovina]